MVSVNLKEEAVVWVQWRVRRPKACLSESLNRKWIDQKSVIDTTFVSTVGLMHSGRAIMVFGGSCDLADPAQRTLSNLRQISQPAMRQRAAVRRRPDVNS